jgi:hypothetical protein
MPVITWSSVTLPRVGSLPALSIGPDPSVIQNFTNSHAASSFGDFGLTIAKLL